MRYLPNSLIWDLFHTFCVGLAPLTKLQSVAPKTQLNSRLNSFCLNWLNKPTIIYLDTKRKYCFKTSNIGRRETKEFPCVLRGVIFIYNTVQSCIVKVTIIYHKERERIFHRYHLLHLSWWMKELQATWKMSMGDYMWYWV